MAPDQRSLVVTALGLVLLPLVLNAIGLTWTSATEVVIFALACMALNVLVGQTGLVSFGHGAWFGLAAYVAGLAQRDLFPGSFLWPALLALGIIALLAAGFGALILRRRGVYFSLLTLALSAMLYVVAFRWTAVTGGENGLGGIVRPSYLGFSFEVSRSYYAFVALVAFAGLMALVVPLNAVAVRQLRRRERAGLSIPPSPPMARAISATKSTSTAGLSRSTPMIPPPPRASARRWAA